MVENAQVLPCRVLCKEIRFVAIDLEYTMLCRISNEYTSMEGDEKEGLLR